MPTTLQTAQALHASGYSVIPTKKDKRPLVSWKEYMTHPPEIVEATAERDVLIARTEKAEAELAEAQTKIYTLHCRIAYLIGLFPNRSDLPDEIKRSDVEAASEREALVARAEKAEAKLASAQKGLQSVVGLIMHTKGVVGLHMNGEIAHWVDLLPGGKLSDWLRDFDRALNDSQSPQPKHTI